MWHYSLTHDMCQAKTHLKAAVYKWDTGPLQTVSLGFYCNSYGYQRILTGTSDILQLPQGTIGVIIFFFLVCTILGDGNICTMTLRWQRVDHLPISQDYSSVSVWYLKIIRSSHDSCKMKLRWHWDHQETLCGKSRISVLGLQESIPCICRMVIACYHLIFVHHYKPCCLLTICIFLRQVAPSKNILQLPPKFPEASRLKQKYLVIAPKISWGKLP